MEIKLPPATESTSTGNGFTTAPTQDESLLNNPAAPLLHKPLGKARRRSRYLALGCVGILGIVAIVLVARQQAKSPSAIQSKTPALPVPVARVTREDLFEEIRIPGEFRPYQEVELHAKVAGYLNEIRVDFGDQVKAGQQLASIEVPELKDQLRSALATQKRAEADHKAAHLAFTRLSSVDKDHPNLVAQQELDSAESRDGTTDAAIAAAKADVERYQTLLAYTRITAPFDGVVTKRYADPGSLIQAGTASDTQAKPLVRLSDNYRLRFDFPVSVKYVKDIHIGDKVEVIVASLGSKSYFGTITRASLRVNEDTRTMIAELEVPNPSLELVPGMYARAVLKGEQRSQALAVPIEAVPPGSSTTVYVVTAAHQLEERPVTLGLDTPTKCEVLSGLKENELVYTGSRSRVLPGQQVEPQLEQILAVK